MSDTIEVTFNNIPAEAQEIMIARLSDAGFEGFEQDGDMLKSFIKEDDFSETILKNNAGSWVYELKKVPAQNWNEVWESNFEPVIVDDFCTIRADFHVINVKTPYEIIITPKMSFGTGHHATTQLMMRMMHDLDFNNKQVLDFGTGTGVLAILAEKLGASYVLGIDNDDWSVENANENLARNGSSKTTVVKVVSDELPAIQSDIILANINRHVLLSYMPQLFKNLRGNGNLLMSGLLLEDEAIVKQSALDQGFTFVEMRSLNGWITLLMKK